MTVSFDKRLRVPEDVLVSDMDGETVLLNLKSEEYFGLDRVGTRMFTAVTQAESIEAAYDDLATSFDVEPQRLRKDLAEILDGLIESGLLEEQE